MKQDQPPLDTTSARIDDLVTGQLPLFAAWLFRRRISRDPKRLQELNEQEQLRADLQRLMQTGEITAPIRASVRPEDLPVPTFSIGGILMKRRTVFIAVTVLALFTITGAIAARHFAPREGDCGCPGIDGQADWWYFHGTYRGKATILTPKGKVINTINVQGSSQEGTVLVRYSHHSNKIAQDTLHGFGRHPIHNAKGVLIAYIDLSPLTTEDKNHIAQDEREVQEDMADFIRRPERVTPSDHKRGFYPVMSLPGVAGGMFMESINAHGFSNWYSHPYSWKSYGNVHVVARLYPSPQTVKVSGGSKEYPLALKRRTVIEEADTPPLPTPDQLEGMDPEIRKAMEDLPTHAVSTPETYWAIARDTAPYTGTTDKGEWKEVLYSGKFSGYGHFVVRHPKTGYTIMTLDVTPTKKASLTWLQRNDNVKDIRVVPGWDQGPLPQK